jgi:hypothetical protein
VIVGILCIACLGFTTAVASRKNAPVFGWAIAALVFPLPAAIAVVFAQRQMTTREILARFTTPHPEPMPRSPYR